MANRTDADAATVHGTNPQTLVEKIVRSKIYNCTFWKESCFALNAESLVDRGAQLKAVGGTFGGARQPCDFLCLVLKMLQIQPDREVILEYILQQDYKYLRLLGAFYLRLVGKPDEVYRYIEPLFNDSRKARIQGPDGNYALTYMDALAEDMLYKDYMFDITLPRLPLRTTLEREQLLGARISGLDDHDIATLEADAEKEAAAAEEMILQQSRAAAGAATGTDAPRRPGDGDVLGGSRQRSERSERTAAAEEARGAERGARRPLRERDPPREHESWEPPLLESESGRRERDDGRTRGREHERGRREHEGSHSERARDHGHAEGSRPHERDRSARPHDRDRERQRRGGDFDDLERPGRERDRDSTRRVPEYDREKMRGDDRGNGRLDRGDQREYKRVKVRYSSRPP